MCHNQPETHPAGWAATAPAAQPHGDAAKKDNTVSGQGFASCKTCHGDNFEGNAIGPTCLNNAACHGAGVVSPHARKPWRGAPFTHATTDTANAPVCYQCHAYTGTANPNNPHVPQAPAAAGTAPGCYNGTMCHNQPVTHPAGWAATAPAAQPHGDAAKKDGTVAGQGFPSCQTCHGNNFAGTNIGPTCLNNAACHGAVASPHARKPWRASAGTTYTHTTTVPAGNAPVCYTCHAYTGTANPNNPHVPQTPAAAGTAPGCYNGTMCHNEAGHPAGWADMSPTATVQPHGAAAKKDNTVSGQGFASCQTCHGANFAGGSANVSCFLCHGQPHAPKPWRGSPYTHTDTDPSNAPVCAQCHRNANPGTPGCFNNTLCHATPVPHPVDNTWVTTPPAAQPHGNNAKAAPGATTGFSYCQVCHGTGTTSPANFGGGSSGKSCYPCHGVSAPHAPKPWRASAGSTYNHTNTNLANAPVCAQCHFLGSPNNPPNHPATPAPDNTAPGCFNSTLCH